MAVQWTVEIPSLSAWDAKLAEFAGMGLEVAMHTGVVNASIVLTKYIQDTKLSGQVLHKRSGRLFDSIHPDVRTVGPGLVEGVVGTSLIYSRIHELGGVIHHTNLFGRGIVADITIPQRPYMAPSAEEFRPRILEFFEAALPEALAILRAA